MSEFTSPKVSILIPVFNREKFIGECIESALAQTFTNIEVVVVDNASTDRTWEICQQFAVKDKRVRTFRNDTNIGPVRNWLRCVDEAQGEFGKILFSDDLMFPRFLEHTLPYLADQDVAFVSTAALIGKKPNEGDIYYGNLGPSKLSCERYFEKLIAKQVTYSPGAALFRMSDFRVNLHLSFPTKIPHDFAKNGAGPDILLYALTALNYKSVALLSDIDVFFRVHAGSYTIANQNDDVVRNYNAAIAWFCKNKLSNAFWSGHVARIWLSDVKRQRQFIPPQKICAMNEGRGGYIEFWSVLIQSFRIFISARSRRTETMSLPNLVIAGAPKSGTTSLFQWLAAHPSVVTSKVKETYYLIDSDYPLFKKDSNFLKDGIRGYAKLFPVYRTGQLCMEATPDYMYQQTAIKVLSELATCPLIIFVLRNPVERILSLHRFAQNNVGSLDHKISLTEFIENVKSSSLHKDQILNSALLHSEYHIWLDAWIQACGKARIKVLFFEDMVNNPLAFIEGVCDMTGIDDKFYNQFTFNPENQSRQIRSVKLLMLKNVVERAMPFLTKIPFIKSIYRKVNVNFESKQQSTDMAAINSLYEYFVEPNRKLALLLDIKLPATWSRNK